MNPPTYLAGREGSGIQMGVPPPGPQIENDAEEWLKGMKPKSILKDDKCSHLVHYPEAGPTKVSPPPGH